MWERHIEKYLCQIELVNFIEVMTSDKNYDVERISKEDRNLIFYLKNIVHRNLIMDRGSQLELLYAYEEYETFEKSDSIPEYKHINSL